jgi:integrase
MYSYGSRHGLVPEGLNPARGIERYKEESRERLLSVAELERLGASIRQAETAGVPWTIDQAKKTKHVPKLKRETVIGEHAAAALRLLIFTGARLREILHLNGSTSTSTTTSTDSRVKTGKKTIVLNAAALAVVSGLAQVGSHGIARDSVGTANERPRADSKRPWALVSRHAGLEGARLHRPTPQLCGVRCRRRHGLANNWQAAGPNTAPDYRPLRPPRRRPVAQGGEHNLRDHRSSDGRAVRTTW